MRTTTFLALAGLLFASCGPAAQGGPQVRSLYDRGDYAGAEQAAGRALEETPDQPELWRLRIDAAIRGGHARRGVDLYMKWHHLRRHYDTDALRGMAVGTLWRALQDPEASVRIQALQAIDDLRLAALYPAVNERLADPSEAVAATAAVTLARRSKQARQRARDLYQSADPRVRAVAVAGLGRAPRGQAQGQIIAALDDPAPAVRRAAVRALGHRFPAAVVSKLLAMARDDADGPVRASALQALARAAPDGASGLARDALMDPYLGARLAALGVLTRRPDAHRGVLIATAGSSDTLVALRAAVALRRAGGEVSPQLVQWGLGHPSWTVRVATLNALAEIFPGAAALAHLDAPLRDDRIEVRLAAARVLARLGRPGEAAAVFVAALAAPRDEPRIQAAVDLLRTGDDRGRDALVKLAASPSAETRRAAARAHQYTDRPTLPLVTVLGDDAATVRVEAAATLLALLRR